MPTDQSPPAHYTAVLSIDATPEEVFAAITNVRGWWSEEIDGPTETLGAEFTYRNEPTHRCTIRVTEIVPSERLAWYVVDNAFDFTQDKTEWKGTEIHFDVARHGDKTEIRFTHVGLVPDYECFEVCSGAWDFYLNTSLRGLIRTGQGLPNKKRQRSSV